MVHFHESTVGIQNGITTPLLHFCMLISICVTVFSIVPPNSILLLHHMLVEQAESFFLLDIHSGFLGTPESFLLDYIVDFRVFFFIRYT